MPSPEKPAERSSEKPSERRERHCAEMEANQAELRESIKTTERLVTQSDDILRRHRNECEADDDPAANSAAGGPD